MSVYHENNFSTTVKVGSQAGSQSTYLNAVPGVQAPFYLTFDPEDTLGHIEVLYCSAKGTQDVSYASAVKDHDANEPVRMTHVAEELDDLWADIATATAAAAAEAPAGTIIAYGKNAVPTGWLLCDGSAVSRTTYSSLFTAISTIYGNGNGSSTFNLPNLQGQIPIGLQAGDATFGTQGSQGGAKTYNLGHQHGMQAHTHASGSGSASATGSTVTADGSPVDSYAAYYAHTHTLGTATIGNQSTATTSTGGSATQNIMSKYVTVYYLIKT